MEIKHIVFKGDSSAVVAPMPNYCPPKESLSEQLWIDRALFSAHSERVVFVETANEGRYFGIKVPAIHLYGAYPDSPVWADNTVVWKLTKLTFEEVMVMWNS